MLRNGKLEIFENFEIDHNLPKYTKAQEVDLTGSIPSNVIQGQTFNGNIAITTANGVWGTTSVPSESDWGIRFNGDGSSGEKDVEIGWLAKLIAGFKKKKENKRKVMTILNFFSSLANNLNDLKVLQDTAIHYESAIATAAKAGQTALVERLKSRLESAKSELQLINAGLTKYLVEDQVVDFYNKTSADKKLKLTRIKNFIKPIPSKILEVKESLDKQFVFDNYVILHYDPNNDATDITQEQKKELEKDPIIFGLISGSRRLYYVGDWIDEYCNLTLDVVVETLKERVNQVNNDKVKTFLDSGLRQDTREKLPNPMASSASTFQIKSFVEKVYKGSDVDKIKEKVVEIMKTPFTTRVKKGVKPAPKPIKTSPASKLKNLGKKKNGK